MKKVFTFLALVLIATSLFPPQQACAQAPDKMSYQAVIRDGGDELVANTQVGMQISIRQTTPDGTAVYTETHTPTTNANGLVSLEIGTGTSSDDFSAIDWSAGPYYIKTETDPDGGTDYTITGTSQLLSVPYALYAETAAAYTETDPQVGANTENYLSKWEGTALVTSTIYDNGYIGIGTQNPSKILEISKSSGSGSQIDLIDLNSQDDGSGSGSKIRFRTSNNSNTLARIGVVDEFNFGGAIQFEVNQAGVASDITTEVMRINKSGRVGIGTVTPSTLLDVNGVITATDGNSTNWNTAYGWGNHADAGYLSSGDVTTYSVGDFSQGGIVFWVDETGQHGLVCAKEDQSTGVRWYAGTYGYTQANGDGPYAGEANTSIIIAAQVAIGDDGSTYAARICNELQITEGGKIYGDWYLPSKEELHLMYQNKATIDVTAGENGGSAFAGVYYFSSTEYSSSYAWRQNFDSGNQVWDYKNHPNRVRAVRAF